MADSYLVAVQEKELLELVRQFLEEKGVVEAMRELETASGVQPPLQQELVFLHELVLEGQWSAVTKYLSPLKTLSGHSSCLYQVCKQQYLELLMSRATNTVAMEDMEKKLSMVLGRLKTLCPSKEEFSSLLFLLTVPKLTSHHDYKDWSVMKGRLSLFRHITEFLHRHVLTSPAPSMKQQRQQRLAQLVAKGLLYEQCEMLCSTRHGMTKPDITGDKILDVCGWIKQQPASSFQNSLVEMKLVMVASKARMSVKVVPPAYKLPLASTSMVVRDNEEEAMKPTLNHSAPEPIQWMRSISVKETGHSPSLSNQEQNSSTDNQDKQQFTPKTQLLSDAGRDFSTPKAQRHNIPALQVASSPVPYHHGTHDTPHVRKRKSMCHLTDQRDTPSRLPVVTLATTVTDPQVVRSVSFSSPADMVAIGANSRTLRVYSLAPLLEKDTGSCKSLPLLYHQPGYHRGSIYCLAWYNDSLLASGSNDQSIRLLCQSLEGQFKDQGHFTSLKSTVRELQFMPSGLLLSCGAGENALRLSDCHKMSMVQTFHGHSSQVLAVASLDENRFASGGEDGTVKLWDIRSGHTPTTSLTLSHAITSLTTYDSQLACSTTAGSCHLMVRSNSKLNVLDSYAPSNNECRSIRYSPCGSWLLSGSYSGEVCLANSSSLLWQPICSHRDKVIQCRWHRSGYLIATTGADKTARLWRLH